MSLSNCGSLQYADVKQLLKNRRFFGSQQMIETLRAVLLNIHCLIKTFWPQNQTVLRPKCFEIINISYLEMIKLPQNY